MTEIYKVKIGLSPELMNTQKQKNMALNFFLNQCKAVIWLVDGKTKLKIEYRINPLRIYAKHIFTK